MSAGFVIFTREAAQALTEALKRINDANNGGTSNLTSAIRYYEADPRVEIAAMQSNIQIGKHIIEMQDVILGIINGEYS